MRSTQPGLFYSREKARVYENLLRSSETTEENVGKPDCLSMNKWRDVVAKRYSGNLDCCSKSDVNFRFDLSPYLLQLIIELNGFQASSNRNYDL